MALDRADLVIVDPSLDGDHEGGREAVALEILERLIAHPPQIGAAQVHQRLALERIELQIEFETASDPLHPVEPQRRATAASQAGMN